jgi:putative restriction endonuclease
VQGFVANTDYEWYRLLSSLHPAPDEVNFWRPSSTANFRALSPGAPLFFKLKAPHHAIAGLGFFAHFSQLPAERLSDPPPRSSRDASITGRAAIAPE